MGAEILLVDDDPKVIEILGESLGRRGYSVRSATSGKQALEFATRRSPELIILDLVLPDMDGIQVLEEVRGGPDADIPVLFMSAESDVGPRLRALDGGADDFLVKPVSLRELHAKIQRTLHRSTRARAMMRRHATLESELTEGRERVTRVTKDFQRQLLSMRTLFTVAQDLNRSLQHEEIVNVVSLTLIGELRVSNMAIFALERENEREFRLLGVKGFGAERFAGLVIPRSSPFVRALEGDPRPHQIARSRDRSLTRFLPDLRLAVFEYATPISVKDEVKGVIFTGPKLTHEDYSDYDQDMLVFITNSVGIAMENARLLKQLQVTYVTTLKSLISIIEAKDPYTKGHTERVAAYSMAIANRLGLPEDEVRRIVFGALLHDIGKLGVLDSVLHKSGKLNSEEWDLLRAHPMVGAQIVEKMEFLSGVKEIVRHHHESWDGRGYPLGLRGEEIPLGARIVTVADSFDAMTTDRSYRTALSLDHALAQLRAGAGIQFDPNVVHVFTEHIHAKGRDLIVPDVSAIDAV